jgi:hypothetical protein
MLARFKRNEYPTLFEIQRPGTVFLFEVLSQLASMDARRLLAFRACVHRVHRGNVTLLEATLPERGGDHTLLSGSAGSQIAPESYVKAFERRWGAQSIRELGQVVLDFSELTEVQQAPFGVWGGSIARPSGLG